jgi:hypothetical protein
MSLAIDPLWLELPEDQPLFQVWRIEKFKPVVWADIGGFYSGDSYIVLNAVKVGTTQRIRRDIYFWIGSTSTADEYGTAAIKTIELDDRFGGEPTQHRETQYHESSAFHELFKDYGGVRYLEGGVDSGFRAVTARAGVKLYRIKGHRNPVLLEVPAAATSLNHGDVFILTSPTHVFLWVGRSANKYEKSTSGQFFSNIRIRFKGAQATRLDDSATTPEFWDTLGGEGPIAAAEAGGVDAETEAENVRRIFKVEGDGFVLVAEKAAAVRTLLTGGAIFIVQRGETVVVVLSKGTPREVKRKAIDIGVDFLKKQGLPLTYSVSNAVEGVASDTLDLLFA